MHPQLCQGVACAEDKRHQDDRSVVRFRQEAINAWDDTLDPSIRHVIRTADDTNLYDVLVVMTLHLLHF